LPGVTRHLNEIEAICDLAMIVTSWFIKCDNPASMQKLVCLKQDSHNCNMDYWRALFSLICLVYFTDIDDCQNTPCRNNATCTDHVNNYTCTCASGFTGRNCQIGKVLSYQIYPTINHSSYIWKRLLMLATRFYIIMKANVFLHNRC
jgi:hypothetical protein